MTISLRNKRRVIKTFNPFNIKKSEIDIERNVVCPKCETEMIKGFLVEKNAPLAITTLGEGIYWSINEEGIIGTRVALCAYACPECGYVEIYFRNVEIITSPIEPEPLPPIPEGPTPEGHLYCTKCRDFVKVDKGDRNVWEIECPICGKKGLLSKVPDF